MPKKKPKHGRKTVRKKAARKKSARNKAPHRRKSRRRKALVRGQRQGATIAAVEERGMGPEAAGQAGDIQGLAHFPGANAESVEELAAEGQAFEAEVISGVENAPDADVAEVTTKESPEDDVPPEYLEPE